MRRALVILLLLAGTARADVVTYDVEGEAQTSDADARTKALDVAFKRAAQDAVDALVSAPNQKLSAQVINDELLVRARLWVSSFKVTRADDEGGSMVLHVAVKVDLDAVRAKLVELGVTVISDAPPPDRGDAPTAARDAVLLLRVTTVESSVYSFGPDQEAVPGAEDAEVSLARRGLALVPVAASGSTSAKGLPIGDDGARELARDAGATVAIVAALDVAAPGRVRGVTGVATIAHAQVRALDVASGRVLGTGQAARGATGNAATVVSATALRAALLEALAVALPRREPSSAAPVLPLPAAGKNEVLLRIRGATGAETEAIRAYVVTAQGVKRASLRRIAADEIVLAVKGLSAERLGALVRGAAELRADARVVDGAVEVSIATLLDEAPDIEVPW